MGFFGGSYIVNKERAKIAEKKGDAFVAKLYGEYRVVGKSCQGEDTDGDSYLSCDFRLISDKNVERIVHLQCPRPLKALFGSSCKESRLILPS